MDNPDQILISAYLDDELTADERARAEQLLASSAEAHELLDEMRTLRSKLQELPQHRLEIDFPKIILRQVELASQTALPQTESHSLTPSPLHPLTSSPPHPSPFTPHHSLFRKRGLAWSLIAIAAAVLITITTRHSDQNRQLAQRAAEPPIVRAPANAEQESVERSKLASELGEATPSLPAASQSATLNADESAASRLADTPAPATNGIAGDKAAENLHFSLQQGLRDGAVANKELPSVQQNAPLATDDRHLFKSATPREAKSFSASGGVGGKIENPSPAVTSEESITNSPVAGSAIQLKAANGKESAGEAQPILVVHADISADAARQGAFDQLLSKNDITLSDEQQKAEPEQFSRMLRDATQLGVSSPDQRSLDVVYVEAGPMQIQNTLAELRKSPSQFSAVTVTNLPDKQNLKLEELSEDKKDIAPALGRAERIALPAETLGGLIAGDNSHLIGGKSCRCTSFHSAATRCLCRPSRRFIGQKLFHTNHSDSTTRFVRIADHRTLRPTRIPQSRPRPPPPNLRRQRNPLLYCLVASSRLPFLRGYL